MASVYDFSVTRRDGIELRLSSLRGKVIMIVATAPALSALVALFGEKFIIPALIVLIAGITGGIVIGTRIKPNDDEPGSKDE